MSRSVSPAGGPARGEVWLVDLNPTVGHEQAGTRPALVVSADPLNRSPAGLAIVAPITGTNRGIPAHVQVDPPEGGLSKTSQIMVDQIRTVSTRRLSRRLGRVSTTTMGRVDSTLRLVLGL